MKKKQYIVRKYVMATSAKDAIERSKRAPVDDVWIDDNWVKNQQLERTAAMGFIHEKQEE